MYNGIEIKGDFGEDNDLKTIIEEQKEYRRYIETKLKEMHYGI